MDEKIATFAAGCFWGVEASLRKMPGVMDIVVGYTGGETENPTYQMVCTNDTGHAEAVQIRYDSEQLSYKGLMRAFLTCMIPSHLIGRVRI